MDKENKVIGKPYFKQLGYYTYCCEMGRDSLRLILEHFPDKKYLVPDHYCPIIIELMDTMKINYEFYHIDEDFGVDWYGVRKADYDIFYSINFKNEEIIIPEEKILLEDNAFCLNFDIKHPQYVGFNSWRKVTPLFAGSMIKSTFELRDTYWRLPITQVALLLQCNETKYKHFILENRDEVQKELAKQQIFLPVFWRGTHNELSEKILSLPMDDRYTEEDYRRVENLIEEYSNE